MKENGMRLFLDTEFNEFGGELISMALVSEDGREWYMVLAIPQKPGAWVAEHVLPVLGQVPLDDQIAFSTGLEIFLSYFDGCEIIADWPADFEHLCNLMSDAGRRRGFIMPIECTMQLICTPELHPTIPHNALSDARALRDWYMASLPRSGEERSDTASPNDGSQPDTNVKNPSATPLRATA